MTWFLFGGFLGGTIGALIMAFLAAGAYAELLAQNDELRARIWHLTRDETHA